MSSCSHNIEKTELDVVGDDIHIGTNLIPLWKLVVKVFATVGL